MEKIRCAFCEKVAKTERGIYRDGLVWAFPTNIPVVPGHVLVCPVRCVATFAELTKEEKEAIFNLTIKLQRVLTKVFSAEGFNYAWNEGEVGGQAVPHFHLHILPRQKGDAGITEYDPRKFLYRPGSREESPESELSAVAELIREAF